MQNNLLTVFNEELREHLDAISAQLGRLPEERENISADALQEMFRRIHSLKGAARAVGFEMVEQLAHRLESVLGRVKAGELVLDSTVVRVIESGLDSIDACAGAVLAGGEEPDTADVIDAIEALEAGEESPIRVSATPATQRTGAGNSTGEEQSPAAAGSPTDSVRISAAALESLLNSSSKLGNALLKLSVLDQHFENLYKLIHTQRMDSSRQHSCTNLLSREPSSRETLRKVYAQSDRNARRLERELYLLRSRLDTDNRHLQRLAADIREDVQHACLVPVKSVFTGFHRMVRELAAAEDIRIDFRISGADVTADRRVLQALKDPVMHLLRNAISHGLEDSATRSRQGKAAEGRLRLVFTAAGPILTVRVEDDGRGLDTAKVTERAVSCGLLDNDRAAAMEEAGTLMQVLFEAGFSTTDNISTLSGRGMGLSVVREAMSALQGRAEAVPADSTGSVFVLACPLNLSLQQFLLVRCNHRHYAVPTHDIDTLLHIGSHDLVQLEGRSCLRREDGADLPVTSLSQLLEQQDTGIESGNGQLPVMVLGRGSNRLGIAVDAYVGEHAGVVKPLGEYAGAGCRLFAGAVVLEDDSIALVINAASLVENYLNTGKTGSLNLKAAPAPVAAPMILLVDDSFTTRTLEKSLLEAHGYRVCTAVDGIDALDKLRLETVELVITDINMPRMDGMALIQAMKAEDPFAAIPIIIVSALEDRVSQERGLELGADAYVVKRDFDQARLLQTIEQLL